jgi:hypothetical protein
MAKSFDYTSIVTLPIGSPPTKDNYLIDVWVYDDFLDPAFTTSHHDPKFNYVAFVSFKQNKKPSIYWNIKPKGDPTTLGQDRYDEVLNNVYDYETEYEDVIIRTATDYFNSRYSFLL